jgi:hypothetical protein
MTDYTSYLLVYYLLSKWSTYAVKDICFLLIISFDLYSFYNDCTRYNIISNVNKMTHRKLSIEDVDRLVQLYDPNKDMNINKT